MTDLTTKAAMPAYPCQPRGQQGNFVDDLYPGLTKREVFAMAAMQGMAVTHDHRGQWSPEAELVAKRSVEYADALLAALEQQQE